MLKINCGFGLLEVIFSIAIFTIIVTGVFGAYFYGQESTMLSGVRHRANLLAEEGLEVVRNMRDNGFANLSEGPHGLSINGGEWNFSGTSDMTNIFTRSIEISPLDSKRKQVLSRVSWEEDAWRGGEIVLTTHLTNWILAHWADPVSNPGSSLNFWGDADGRKIQVQGNYVYAITDGSQNDYVIIDVSNLANSVVVGEESMDGKLENLTVDGDYSYVAASSTSRELQVVEIDEPDEPEVKADVNTPGKAHTNGIYVFNDVVYILREESGQEELLMYDVSDPENPTFLDGVEMNDDGMDLVVIGNYAYISSRIDSQELIVVDVSVPSSSSIVGSYDLNGNHDGMSIAGFGTTIILGRSNGELWLFDVSDPINPVKYDNNLNIDRQINDIALGSQNQYVFLATAVEDGKAFFVVDISTPSNPVLASDGGSMIFEEDLNGVIYQSETDRVFLVGVNSDNQSGFIVIEPQ